jgi:hypothetical protein
MDMYNKRVWNDPYPNKGRYMKVNQKSAVYAAIVNVLSEAGIAFEDGMDVGPHMTKERRAQVNTILFYGFRNDQIELDAQYSDTELKAYVSGLQSNWIRKDGRLNGNTKYIAKNPGSRAGSGDAQLTAMKALLTTLTQQSDKDEVQVHIDARIAEIAKSKAKTIDFSALPADLQAKFKT